MNGIDISYWQKDNYKYLIDTFAPDFVISRASFNFNVDETCDPIYQYAKSQGKQRGVYFFPLNANSSAEESARWCYEQVLGYINHAVIILDYETYSENGVCYNDVSNTEWAYRWLKEFERLSGVKPLIYLNTWTCNNYDWSKVANADFGLWLADYNNNDGSQHDVPAVKWWSFVAMHQYTSNGTAGGLDKDVFFGDKSAWRKYANASDSNKKSEPKKEDEKYYYTVKAGDCLSVIAEKCSTTVANILKLNPDIKNPDLIYPNQVIRVR